MAKIDMTDKFYHAVMWDEVDRNKRLQTFRDILKCGYLLSTFEQYKMGVDYNSELDRTVSNNIYLSVYPKGIYCDMYKGNPNTKFIYDSFYMTNETLYFILSSKLKEDYNIIPGKYPNECLIKEKIDLYKYLVGVGNTGFNIDKKVLSSYFITRYMNEEITREELIQRLSKMYLYNDINKVINELYSALLTNNPHYNYFDQSTSLEPVDLIQLGDYCDVKRILEEENCNIGIYDTYGYYIEPEEQLTKVKGMQEYLQNNRKSKEEYLESLRTLNRNS